MRRMNPEFKKRGSKLPYSNWKSCMAKLDNELNAQTMAMKKVRDNTKDKKGDK